jgi:hypothetical protein
MIKDGVYVKIPKGITFEEFKWLCTHDLNGRPYGENQPHTNEQQDEMDGCDCTEGQMADIMFGIRED